MSDKIDISDEPVVEEALEMIGDYAEKTGQSFDEVYMEFGPEEFEEILDDRALTDKVFDQTIQQLDQDKFKHNVRNFIKDHFKAMDNTNNYVNDYLITDYAISHNIAKDAMRQQSGMPGLYDRNDYEIDEYNNNFDQITDDVIDYMRQSLNSIQEFVLIEALDNDGFIDMDFIESRVETPFNDVNSFENIVEQSKKQDKKLKM